MKKAFYILLSLLTLAVSCQKELDFPVPEPSVTESDSTVTIRFNVTAPEAVSTKAMANQPQIRDLHVAVFGSSGYLKEYVLAEPVELADHERDNENDSAHEYAYQVKLSLTRSRIRVHFIANGPAELPFDYESTVIGQLTTSGTQDAYWQKIILPNGIFAQDDAGSRQNPPVYTVDPDFDLVDGEHVMAKIPLIRNFAKITVTSEADNLTIKSFAVVNVPLEGTVAPYNTESGEFIMNYSEFTDMDSLFAVYPGNMPASTTIQKVIPDPAAFINGTDGVALANSSDPNVYMYERPKPTSNASFVLIYATYSDNDAYSGGYDCYYKIDLMDKGEYLPIYRNFRYHIIIKSVYRPGKDNPTSAANGAGSGDISSDTETANLDNVSDGMASIAVSFTDQTYTDAGTYSVKYRFVPNISNGDVHNEEAYVTFELLSPGATGASIQDGTLVRAAADDPNDTYRELSFTTTEISTVQKTQKIRITGIATNGSRTSRLYREVNIRLMPRQTMTLVCSPQSINQQIGEAVDLYINIPKDLPSSIFPLQFTIESSELSITPNNDNLPVEAGNSIISSKNGKPSFHFIKTLSREEYMALEQTAPGNTVAVPCHFKSNVAVSASDVYVANKYFTTASTSFGNFIERYFTGLSFTNNTAAEGEITNFKFLMDYEHYNNGAEYPDYVYVTLNGLIPADDEDRLVRTSGSTYRFTVNPSTASMEQSLKLEATGETDEYSVTLEATHYQTATKAAAMFSFTNLAFSAVPFYGNGWPVNFTFNIPNDYEMPDAGYIDIELGLTNLVRNTSDANIREQGGKVYYRATSTGAQTLHLRTSGNRTEDVAVSLNHGDFRTASLNSGRRYLTIAQNTFSMTYGNNAPNNNTNFYIYSDKQASDELATYRRYNTYYNRAITFDTAIDYDQSLYIRYTSSNNTYRVTTTAGHIYDGGAITFSTNAFGTKVVPIATTSANYSTSNSSHTEDGATVEFSSIDSVNGTYVQMNSPSDITVSVPDGYHISRIVINFSGDNGRPQSVSITSGGGSTSGTNPTTWTTNSTTTRSVTLRLTKRDNGWFTQRNLQPTSVEVTFVED